MRQISTTYTILQIFRITFTITTALEHQMQSSILSYFTIALDPAFYPLQFHQTLSWAWVIGYNVADRCLTSIRLPFCPVLHEF